MKKKYLKTVEDVVALKDTDTKIYAEKDEGRYYQFVKGVLCCFSTNNNHVCIGDWVTLKMNLYILEEEPMQEATEDDIGKLCWMWDTNEEYKTPEILKRVSQKFSYEGSNGSLWLHCRRLSPSEVAEITGYGVTEDGSTFYGEPFKIVGKEK